MKKPERSNYTTLDFLQWHNSGNLVISPKFQRRGVWGRPAQSYLIDTLLLDLPVPPVYLRVTQDIKKGMIREVVDGQQRLSSVLSYVNNQFSLTKNIESPAIGKRFDDLTEEQRNKILQYSFVCEVFYGVDDGDILKIFSRLNTHSVKLNAQELRNGRFFGEFKRCCFDLSFEHLQFWREQRIFSEQAIARMQEVELTSELVIALLVGLQDKKKSIDSFYKLYDDQFPSREEVEARFRSVIDVLTTYTFDVLPKTEFRRVPLFYSLFTAVAHRKFALPGVDVPSPANGRIVKTEGEKLRDTIVELSAIIENAKDEDGAIPENYRQFVNACLRQTDNLRPRRIRLDTIYNQTF